MTYLRRAIAVLFLLALLTALLWDPTGRAVILAFGAVIGVLLAVLEVMKWIDPTTFGEPWKDSTNSKK